MHFITVLGMRAVAICSAMDVVSHWHYNIDGVERRHCRRKSRGETALARYKLSVPPLAAIDALPFGTTHVLHHGAEDARCGNMQRGGRRLALALQHQRRRASPLLAREPRRNGACALQLCRTATCYHQRAAL